MKQLIILLLFLIISIDCLEQQTEFKQSTTSRSSHSSHSSPTTKKSNNSHGSNQSPFLDFLLGFILIGVSIGILWYNERREAITEYRLEDTKKKCITINADFMDEKNNFKLVHISGITRSTSIIQDDDFGIRIDDCIKLKRKVQMFQLIKKERKDNDGNIEEYYVEQWEDNYIEKDNHQIEDLSQKEVVKKAEIINQFIQVGVYQLSNSLKKKAKYYRDFQIETMHIEAAKNKFGNNGIHEFFKKENANTILFSQSQDETTLGDLKISFMYVPCGKVGIVSQIQGDSLSAYRIEDKYTEMSDLSLDSDQNNIEEQLIKQIKSKGCCDTIKQLEKPITKINWIYEGSFTKEEIFNVVLNENQMITKVVRVVGFILIWIGFMLIFSPISFLISYIPFLGNFLSAISTFLFAITSLLLSIVMSTITIGIAWVFYNPMKGLILFAIAFTLMIGVMILMMSHQEQ